MLQYLSGNYMKVLTALGEHLVLVVLTLLVSVPLALLLSLLISRNKRLGKSILFILLLIYCIPSIALFTFLIPWLGLGKLNAICAMTAFNQILLVRNITVAEQSISGDIIEAAKGMGLSDWVRLRRIDFPLMKPHLISGLRIATISTTGIASMSSLINAGGLGVILFEGMRQNHTAKLLIGVILISGLAFLFNTLFTRLEYKALMQANGHNPNVFWVKH